ncbi:putative G-protein coupled receptor Mth-like 6 [Lycorma delicatula]|uniref:putative G-protein coupled receptor Mth-like 6 n=1 Tax=Lycorma delicatula TaxID=130591 RepID=UPI003F516DBB
MELINIYRLIFLMNLIILCEVKIISKTENSCKKEDLLPFYENEVNPDGSITWEDYNITIPKHMVYNDTDGITACACSLITCLRKCCRYSFSYNNKKCTNNGNTFDYGQILENTKIHTNTSFDIYNKFTMIEQQRYDNEYSDFIPSNKYIIFENGTILIKSDDELNHVTYSVYHYCLEWSNTTRDVVARTLKSKERHVAFEALEYVAISISLPLLLFTFFVYCVIPELNNLFGKCLMSKIAASFTQIIAHLFVNFYITTDKPIPFIIYLADHIHKYSTIASYFWMSLICYEIWRVFRCSSGQIANNKEDKVKFIKYSLYGWGVPLVLYFVLHQIKSYIYYKSQFDNEKKKIYSLVIHGSILITVNIVNSAMFISTTCNIFKQQKQTKTIQSGINRCNEKNRKEGLYLYLTFFFVMGMCRIPNVFVFIFELNWLMEAVSVLYEFEGVFLFIIFICKGRILRAIRDKFFPSGSFTKTSKTTSSSSLKDFNLAVQKSSENINFKKSCQSLELSST